MKEVYIDRGKPLWWILLVIFFVAIIYSIGTTSENDEYSDNVTPNLVENLKGGH